jgi:sulfonate dioxygenase
MAPVATTALNGGSKHHDHDVKKQVESALLSNPFYSPAGEDDKDDSYKYAKFKVGNSFPDMIKHGE